jgi:integrase
MFNVDYKKLTLSFNEFHDVSDKDMPQYGEYCLLELKTGAYTAGGWHPSGNGRTAAGQFIRGTADSVNSEDVARWHSLERYDLTDSLEQEEVDWINLGPEEEGVRNALEEEPVKWKMLVHLYMIAGARRGEILGLKWAAVDFAHNRIHIENNILYSVDRGIYEDTPKTESSVRWVTLPAETMALLKEWRAYQAGERLRLGEYYQDQGFVFARENGQPMHPDSVTDWMKKLAQRHDLPHINPHAFRHTMASTLYFNNVDSVSISKRLGHAKVSTTEDIYAHVIEAADQRNADILSDVFLKKA